MHIHESSAGTGVRVGAACAGAIALLLAVLITVGTALFALIGIAVAASIMHRKGARLSVLSSWIGATSGVAIAFLLVTGGLLATAPAGTWTELRQGIDSAVAQSQQEQSTKNPGAAAQIQTGSTIGKAIVYWAAVVGTFFAIGFLASLIGSIAWIASLPVHFAYAGRWLWQKSQPPAAI